MLRVVKNNLAGDQAIQPAVYDGDSLLFTVNLLQPESERLEPTLEFLEFAVETLNNILNNLDKGDE